MQPGRCITGDYGHVMGCYADVTADVSETCDYRQNCTLLVATMDSVVQPCAKDFKSYLQAYYVCIKGRYLCTVVKGSVLPYSLPSAGPGLIPVYKSSPGGRLQLLSARPAVTFPAEERHCPLTSTKLYCLVTDAHRCEQLAQGCYAVFSR